MSSRRAGVIHGFDGHDVIDGRSGDDVICGGNGNDTVVGSAGDDVLFGIFGKDTLKRGDGADQLNGGGTWGEDNDTCYDDDITVFECEMYIITEHRNIPPPIDPPACFEWEYPVQ